MSKTIQVRVDDQLKESADILFSSLGLDTSTAIRIFLVASMNAGGIPFAVINSTDRDSLINESRSTLLVTAKGMPPTFIEATKKMRIAVEVSSPREENSLSAESLS